MTMTEENKKWFNEFLTGCSDWFGDRQVEGHTLSIIDAFENDMADYFVGSTRKELNVMSMIFTIQHLLSQEVPDNEKASQIAEAVQKIIFH